MKILFSEIDADLRRLRWRLNRYGYARTNWKTPTGIIPGKLAHKIVIERMHNKFSSELCVDHINGNKLDNRRENLRLVTKAGNSQNRHLCGKYRGTTWHKQCKKWQASVGRRMAGKVKYFHLGLFSNRKEAALAAKNKRRELGFLDNGNGSPTS